MSDEQSKKSPEEEQQQPSVEVKPKTENNEESSTDKGGEENTNEVKKTSRSVSLSEVVEEANDNQASPVKIVPLSGKCWLRKKDKPMSKNY